MSVTKNGPFALLIDLTWMREDTAQWQYSLRSVFNALRWRVRSGTSWRLLPHDLPPWWTVQQQAQRWIQAGCFEAMAADLQNVVLKLPAKKT